MSHPEQATSRKVSALTDFEYRVWEQTKLSADDFGVMPYSATVLRADNLRLRGVKEASVFSALRQLVKAGLLLTFTHQGEEYAFAPVWQTWQQVRFPRKTSRPRPDEDALAKCDAETRELFRKHPGGRTKIVGQSSDTDQTRDGSKGGHSGHEVPASANASANAPVVSSLEESPRETRYPVGGGRPRSIVEPPARWGVVHGDHVAGFCDWKCFPNDLANQFATQLAERDGITVEDASGEVVLWAKRVRASGVMPTGSKFYEFWNGQWEATHGTSKPVTEGAAGRQNRTKQNIAAFVEHG